MARRRKRARLGAGPVYHVRSMRETLRYGVSAAKSATAAARKGDCGGAFDYLLVASQDFGAYHADLKATGLDKFETPHSRFARRSTSKFGTAMDDARTAFRKSCTTKNRRLH